MALSKQKEYISEQDYLDGELLSAIKHEYIDGEVYAMAGASIQHSYLTGNIFTAFNMHLRGHPCRPLTSDVKVKIGKTFFYPDAIVDCGEEEHDYFTETPTIIVEVLSPSTRQHDKTFKRDLYFTIPTLQEYVLIEQDIAEIEMWQRNDNNMWQQNAYYLGDSIYFASIDLNIAVEDIYQRVKNTDVLAWLEKKAQENLSSENQTQAHSVENKI